MIKKIAFFLTLASISFMNAQEVTARILDSENNPVIFAAVQNNANSGVITNEEGYFSITLDETNKTLHISCLGFKSKEVTYKQLQESGFIIVLEEQVNELDTVFVSNTVPDANEIIRMANEQLSKNYQSEEVTYRIFFRGTEYNQFQSLKFEIDKASGFKKKELAGVNLSLDSLTDAIKESQSIDFTDYLADLMIWNKENAKLDVVKATKLVDSKNAVSVDKIQDRAQEIFLTYLDTTKTYKLKTGILKIEDSLSLNGASNGESVSKYEYNTSNLKDQSHEHLHNAQIYENTTITRLLDPNLYDYQFLKATVFNGELVYVIGYEPRRSKAKFEGVLYIADESFAVLKADYSYADGKRGDKLNLKFLLGIKFVENLKKGTIIYSKEGDFYQPKYIKEETGAYFYVNRPIKFIENSKEKRKVGFSFLVEGSNRNKQELLIVANTDLDRDYFDGFSESENTPYQELKAYDPSVWTEYTSLEPLQEMKTFKAKD